MNNREYSALVEAGKFPADPTVPLDEPFVNGNGNILNLLTEKFTHAAILNSVAGSIRANHYHKTDWHYTYVISGEVEYCWREIGAKTAPNVKVFKQGTMFFSPPMLEHAMVFRKDAVIITFAKNARSEHQTHEDDLVRVALVKKAWNPHECAWEFDLSGK
jgi:dTDP-4-dehydrorhamnose 3,5-epimerase-like enzyme